MYYVSQSKKDLEDYNNLVTQGEKYDGVKTVKWANVIEHPDEQQFAILKHSKYEVTGLTEVGQLTPDWFPQEELT